MDYMYTVVFILAPALNCALFSQLVLEEQSFALAGDFSVLQIISF